MRKMSRWIYMIILHLTFLRIVKLLVVKVCLNSNRPLLLVMSKDVHMVNIQRKVHRPFLKAIKFKSI